MSMISVRPMPPVSFTGVFRVRIPSNLLLAYTISAGDSSDLVGRVLIDLSLSDGSTALPHIIP